MVFSLGAVVLILEQGFYIYGALRREKLSFFEPKQHLFGFRNEQGLLCNK